MLIERFRKMFTAQTERDVKGFSGVTATRLVCFGVVLTTAILFLATIVRPVDPELGGQVEGSLFVSVQDRQVSPPASRSTLRMC